MAEAKGFNLADVLKAVPKTDTGPERIERIDIDRLGDDPKNFYSLSDLDSLAENIELVGLQQPLRVRPDREAHGYYIIVSGHRRRAAIQKLVDDGREDLRRIPCIVEQPAESEAMQELRLIFANSGTRKLTDPEIAAQADRVQNLLYRLKEEGYDFPGRMRDHVAEACQVSKSKLARLNVIQKGLEEPLLSRWQAGKLDEAVAYALARMPMELQWRLGSFKKLPTTHALETIRKRAESGATWKTELRCPGGSACSHADGFLRCYGTSPYYGCDGTKCCMTCSVGAKVNYGPCSYMCSTAKAARKERKAKEKANQERAEQRRITAAQKKTVLYARRIAHAADAAGLADNVTIAWRYAAQRLPLGHIRKWAQEDFSEGWNSYMDDPELSPNELVAPLSAAKTLQCSADYLLGLTDELHPCAASPVYITDRTPDAPTEALILLDFGMVKPYRTTGRWDGEKWLAGGMPLSDRLLGWYPIPETPNAPEEEAPESDVTPDSVKASPCVTGLSPSGYCGAAAHCDSVHLCCSYCDEDCNIRCGWISKEVDSHDKT